MVKEYNTTTLRLTPEERKGILFLKKRDITQIEIFRRGLLILLKEAMKDSNSKLITSLKEGN